MKLIKAILTASCLFSAISAEANECLRSSTNDDLLRELGRRLHFHGQGPAPLRASFLFTCSRAQLKVSSYEGSYHGSLSVKTDDIYACRDLKDSLSSKLTRLSKSNVTFASCNRSELNLTTLFSDGRIIKAHSLMQDNIYSCRDKRDEINDRL